VIKDGVTKDIICLSIEMQKILVTFSPRRPILKTKSAVVHKEARGVSSQYPKRPGGRTSQVTLRHGEPSVLEWLVFQLKRVSLQRSCAE
jgi:hypothetical protein